jgi:hypothetical protein
VSNQTQDMPPPRFLPEDGNRSSLRKIVFSEKQIVDEVIYFSLNLQNTSYGKPLTPMAA